MKLTVLKSNFDVYLKAFQEYTQALNKNNYEEAHRLSEITMMTAPNVKLMFAALYSFGHAASHDSATRYSCGSYTIYGDLAKALIERNKCKHASLGKFLLYMILTSVVFCLTAMVLFYPPVTEFIDGFITYDNFLIVCTVIAFIGFFLGGFGGVAFVLVIVGAFVWLATSLLTEAMIILIGCWAARIAVGILLLYIAKSCFFHNIANHSRFFSRSAKIKELSHECRTYAEAIYVRVLWAQHESADKDNVENWLSLSQHLQSEKKLFEYIEFALGYYKSVIDECTL